MYIHIGGDISVIRQDITAIVDLETVLPSQKSVMEFINSEDDKNRLQYLTDDIPRSLVLTLDRTYLSPLSTSVLKRRLEGSADMLENDINQ